MNVKISKGLVLVAVLYFTANFNAQTTPRDTVQKEQKIEEVVVIGYGSVKKSNLTSAVSTVKSETFDDRPIYNVGQALQGNAAGVNVIQSSGKPGAAIDVKIRGNNSISSSVNPLYVVDGIQTFDISGINPDDITDMTILKDATSAAIYGINGSSGVVIVTTKRGKANKPQLAFNAYWGMSKTVNNIDVLNLDQYKTLMSEINPSYLTTINNPRYAGINTNWRDEVFRTGFDQNYNVNYSFGNEKVRAYTALGYQGIDGIIDPARFDRISAKMNLDAKITNWLKLTGNFNYINTTLKNTNDNLGTSRGGVILSALNTPSFLPIYGSQLAVRDTDTEGNYLDGYKDGQFALNPFQSSWENPVAYQSRKNETQTQRFMSNLGLEVNLLKNLVWKPTVSFDLIDVTNDQFTDGYQTSYGRQQKGIGGKYLSTYQDLNVENTLTYTIKSGVHDLALLGGNQIHEKRNSWHNYSGRALPEGATTFDFNTATLDIRETLVKEHLRELSFFGRALYTLDNKYTIMGVFRYNGSSALAPGNKWGFFPGVSGAWTVSNEDFMADSKIFSELKLRGGWGQSGNASGIPPYSHYNLERLYRITPPGVQPVWNSYQWDSSDLGWETTTDANVGLDFGFLSNRIKLSVDAYKRKTKDLIVPISFESAGIGNILKNIGSMENQGLEFALNTQNFKGEFTWNTNFNISFTKNKVLSLNYRPNIDVANIETVGANLVRFSPGQAISSFYGYQVSHVDSQTGDLVYKDNNGNGLFDTGDRTFIGNPNPNFSFGFSNNFSFKNWYLDVLITGSYGGEIYNASRFDLEMMNDFKNQSTAVLNRWTTPGQITNTPRANSANSQFVSDRFVEDGSFIKIKSATLGYNFLSPFKGVSKVNIYVTGQNLLTWTDYTGFDPEVNAFNTTNGVSGIDYGTYPQVRTFIFGLKANF